MGNPRVTTFATDKAARAHTSFRGLVQPIFLLFLSKFFQSLFGFRSEQACDACPVGRPKDVETNPNCHLTRLFSTVEGGDIGGEDFFLFS